MNSDAKLPRKPSPWESLVAFLATGILAAWAMFSTTSCSTTKYINWWHTEYRDTTIYQKERYDSLIYVDIPLETNQVIVEIGDTSRLETSVAKSLAFVNDKGHICHTLENKREKLPVLIPVTSTTIYAGVTSNATQTITLTQWRDKPLTWWQNFRIRAFWGLLVAVVFLLLWTFRKPLLKMIRK